MKISPCTFIASIMLFALTLCATEESQPIEQIILQRYSDITSMNASINYLLSQINTKKMELEKEHDENRKAKIKAEISQLTNKLNVMKMAFTNTITDIDFFAEEDDSASKPQGKRDILKELQEILIPFIDSLKNATKSPRKIEKLRNDIERINIKNSQAEEAIQNIVKIETLEQFRDMRENIESSKQKIQKVIDENNVLKNIYKRDLEKALKGKASFFVITDTIHGFFATKGKDLLIALSVGLLVAFILKWFKKIIFKLKYFINDQKLFKKAFGALYAIFTGVLSVVAGISTLYILNDWFLFSLALLILIALFWSLKAYLPKFLAEVKIILNLGPVKEGQRIVWNNCPWIVKKLGMSVQLENEYLDSKIIALPLREISSLYSRPVIKDEPLFPSKKGDFVLLSDSTYGKVITQTSENVAILLSSTLKKTFSVQEYLLLKPLNYSNGFLVKMKLSLDYKHQKDIFEIEGVVKKELSELIQNNIQFPARCFKNLIIEFKEPVTHSLDFIVWVDCAGELAPEYFKVCRFINAMLLKICNKHNLSIPYPHLQVILEK